MVRDCVIMENDLFTIGSSDILTSYCRQMVSKMPRFASTHGKQATWLLDTVTPLALAALVTPISLGRTARVA